VKARHAILVALAAAVLVVFVGTASAFGTVRDLFLGTTAGSRSPSRASATEVSTFTS
jgi:hypothetical protein